MSSDPTKLPLFNPFEPLLNGQILTSPECKKLLESGLSIYKSIADFIEEPTPQRVLAIVATATCAIGSVRAWFSKDIRIKYLGGFGLACSTFFIWTARDIKSVRAELKTQHEAHVSIVSHHREILDEHATAATAMQSRISTIESENAVYMALNSELRNQITRLNQAISLITTSSGDIGEATRLLLEQIERLEAAVIRNEQAVARNEQTAARLELATIRNEASYEKLAKAAAGAVDNIAKPHLETEPMTEG